MAFTGVTIFISFPDQRLYIVKYMCIYTDTYLTAYRLYMYYRCYQMIMWVKRFYTYGERCDVFTGYLSLGRRLGDDLANM